jgi:hypothetical protein
MRKTVMALGIDQVAIVKGMLARGDKQHDIAAYFGVNGGRIAEVAGGVRFPDVSPASQENLPPPRQPRFIDPKAQADVQFLQLKQLIGNSPQNSRVLTFTPALCALILIYLNEGNRKKRVRNIKRFSEAMRKGWGLTGDTVKFSRDGKLLDGQNRLAACVKAGVPFTTHVVFGIDPEAFTKVDIGAIRTNPDTLHIMGVPRSEVVGRAVRWLMIGSGGDRSRTFENEEVKNYYVNHVDEELMNEASKRASAVSKAISRGALAAHLYLFMQRDKILARRFAIELASKTGTPNKLLMKLTRLREQNDGRLHETQVNALIVLTWNSMRRGHKLTVDKLRWTTDEEFPEIL